MFAVNTYDRWSNAAANEYDIFVDVERDKSADYIVVGVDQGAVQTGTFNGRHGRVRVQHAERGRAASCSSRSAPTTASTILISGAQPASSAATGEPCLSAANPRLTY